MNYFMGEAIKEAKNGVDHRRGGPFGAVIVKDGKIVGYGHNQVLHNQDPTCHGEIMAIKMLVRISRPGTYLVANFIPLLILAQCVLGQSNGLTSRKSTMVVT